MSSSQAKRKESGDAVLQAVSAYKDDLLAGRISKKKLAEVLVIERPDLFSSAEHPRRMVRYYTGSCGDKDRAKDGVAFDFKSSIDFGVRIPPSMAQPKDPYSIRGIGKVLVLSDIHFPFHDPESLDLPCATESSTDALHAT